VPNKKVLVGTERRTEESSLGEIGHTLSSKKRKAEWVSRIKPISMMLSRLSKHGDYFIIWIPYFTEFLK